MLSRFVRAGATALTLAVFMAASVVASDGTPQHDPVVPVPEAALCSIDPGFIATFEDRSNDTEFAVIAEDQSHDTGFLVGIPIDDACDDTPGASPDDPERPTLVVTIGDGTRDSISSP